MYCERTAKVSCLRRVVQNSILSTGDGVRRSAAAIQHRVQHRGRERRRHLLERTRRRARARTHRRRREGRRLRLGHGRARRLLTGEGATRSRRACVDELCSEITSVVWGRFFVISVVNSRATLLEPKPI